MTETTVALGFEDQYRALHHLALRRARQVVKDDGEAEEIAQEAMLRAYAGWPKISSYAEAWTARVATNLAISRLRHRDRQPNVSPPCDASELDIDHVDLAAALETLPQRQREVAVLRYVADLSETEVAARLGISVGAVKRHLHRATETLKDLPSLASGYKRNYEFEQLTVRIKKWMEENFLPAPEPPGGWPPPPWDRAAVISDGYVRHRLIDRAGNLILDADGNEVAFGVGWGYVPGKPYPGLRHPWQEVMVPVDSLDVGARQALDRAFEIAERLGETQLTASALGMALTECLPGHGPLDRQLLLKGMALERDGPHAQARLVLFAKREASGWTRPSHPGVLPVAIGCEKELRDAVVRASRREELASCDDLLHALMIPPEPFDFPPLPPPEIFKTMGYAVENRYPDAIDLPRPIDRRWRSYWRTRD